MESLGSNPLITRCLQVHGVTFTFETNCSALETELARDFGRYYVDSGGEDSGTAVAGSLRVMNAPPPFPLQVPVRAIRESITPAGIALFANLPDRYLLVPGSRIIHLDMAANAIEGFFQDASRHAGAIRFLFKWLVIKGLEREGFAFVHGACLERDGATLLFVGPSGSGKTRSLLTCVGHGYRLLADDAVFTRGGKLYPFYTRSTVHEQHLVDFPHLRRVVEQRGVAAPEGGWLLDLRPEGNVAASSPESHVVPSKLFYLYVWNAEETSVKPVPPQEMLARLVHVYKVEMANTMWINYDVQGALSKIFPEYNQLINEVEGYKVMAGGDVNQFFESVAGA